MEWGQQMRKHQQVSRDVMYHNSNYTNSRETKKCGKCGKLGHNKLTCPNNP